MEISLKTLFEKQKQLDDYIIKKKGLDTLPKQELLNNTVLALQVEICELANEWRGFKHWSENREPKNGYEALIDCDKCDGRGFWFDGPRVLCEKCNHSGKITNPLLEEYVDCLHFFLSIAWQIGLTADGLYTLDEVRLGETSVAFTELLFMVAEINGNTFLMKPSEDVKFEFRISLNIFFSLGYQRFGFTWDEITQAYIDKWKINMQRQESGY
ncbi:dUTPase [Brevibacillus phage Jimmer1]|uniref:dUTPase n=5 Tax=Caudoviricetes TaxID=2731619 RepID=S5M6F9_9CAUD|nr:nucleoside triphosphate pyrophosphohydrolase [Brevibacillus phage Davies]YP_009215101.1 nucleoside triphosphate pyrophosphohydrolase [Brevibacillus phage Osiris]YP_009226397.1 nucleoside triphosphate pyrophosphohydrolase [Brevibacillus phage Jimmer1]YP_009606514.1 nucleoside triphosphate pyrophosphohydrolase [Brevibacillus phage Jimmer2]ALA48097.1 dUTPase [Brevibacillus phage Powder]AGR47631.1 dUTPase [Brevibacillus phage Davies]AGY37118.1 dUTPase [Brevibacillus phage Jimmer2]AGY37125.1 d